MVAFNMFYPFTEDSALTPPFCEFIIVRSNTRMESAVELDWIIFRILLWYYFLCSVTLTLFFFRQIASFKLSTRLRSITSVSDIIRKKVKDMVLFTNCKNRMLS